MFSILTMDDVKDTPMYMAGYRCFSPPSTSMFFAGHPSS